jgi:hypothetical protein
MGIRKTPRLLAGVSAIAILGAAGCGESPDADTAASSQSQTGQTGADAAPESGSASDGAAETAPNYAMAGEGEGEGAGGNSGGEFGIDPDAAANDPVVYLTALEVMRAHYVAGLAALDAGERSAGAAMFAHPISEIYVDLEPVIEERGVESFIDTLNAASVAPYEGASEDEIEARVNDVLAALDRAEAAAPAADDMVEVHARVLADLIERAALQYEFARREPAAGEAYLDGYGFAHTAAQWADAHMAEIEGEHGEFAEAARMAVERLQAVFETPVPPESYAYTADEVVEASEGVQSALSEL